MRAARFRPLPDRFAGDSFRNVTLFSLAGGRERLYLAFGADAGGHADVRLVRSDDAGAHWADPSTVGAGGARRVPTEPRRDPRGRVHVSFLDRRLDPTGAFADEWLASSRDAGATWKERRLSHESWDPADRRAALAHRRPARRPSGLAVAGCTLVALAADPHLALLRERAATALPRSPVPAAVRVDAHALAI